MEMTLFNITPAILIVHVEENEKTNIKVVLLK